MTDTAVVPAHHDAPVTPDIRVATRASLKALKRDLGQAAYFDDRFRRQQRDKGLLLVAWDGDRAIGVAYLWWEPAEEWEIRTHLPKVPLLTHVEVSSDYRSLGMGSKLIARAEHELARRRYTRVALAVEITNHRAEDLYSRLGYVVWKHGVVKCLPFPDGTPQAVEICKVMVKRLRGVTAWRNR